MDTIVDLHTHSVLSRHAYSSVTENIEYAYSKGLKVYGISEHQYDDFNVGAHHFVFLNGPRAIPNYWHEMRVLKGAELNILDGHFDVDKIKPQILDYCIASMHTYVYSKDHTAKENTDNYIMQLIHHTLILSDTWIVQIILVIMKLLLKKQVTRMY